MPEENNVPQHSWRWKMRQNLHMLREDIHERYTIWRSNRDFEKSHRLSREERQAEKRLAARFRDAGIELVWLGFEGDSARISFCRPQHIRPRPFDSGFRALLERLDLPVNDIESTLDNKHVQFRSRRDLVFRSLGMAVPEKKEGGLSR